jgi:tetratricopeptide (TPR) repeat protein
MLENYWPDFNDLWDYNDPAATEHKFRARLPDLAPGSSEHLQLLTQIARTHSLRRQFAEAHALLDEVESQADPASLVQVRLLLERGRCYNSADEPARAVQLFQQAADLGAELGADFYTVDALHMLGIAAPPDERLDWNRQAIQAAAASADAHARRWLASLYNNTAWALFDQERYAEALELFEQAVAEREQMDSAENLRIARWCVARTLRALGEPGRALVLQRELAAESPGDGFIEEEIGENLLVLEQPHIARRHFARAYELLSQLDWVAEDEGRMARLKQLGGIES